MKKLNCWEFNKCGRSLESAMGDVRSACPASVEVMLDGIHGGLCAGRACWIVADTLCKGKPMGKYADKRRKCMKCAFYREVRKQEGEGFMDVSRIVRHADSGAPVLGLARDYPGALEADRIEIMFSDALVSNLKTVKENCGYCEPRFAHMVADLGAVRAVKRMLKKQQFIFGLSVMGRCGCAGYSAERLVLDYRFSFLFDESERLTALSRLMGSRTGGLEAVLLGKAGDTDQVH